MVEKPVGEHGRNHTGQQDLEAAPVHERVGE